MARSTRQASFFPRVDGAILTSSHPPPLSRPEIIGPVFDQQNVDQPISEWSNDVQRRFYPDSGPYGPSACPEKPGSFGDRYLRAFLSDNERLRLSVLWYYSRDVLSETEFLSGLQEKVHLAKESAGWEFAVIGLLDLNVYTRLATVGLELGVLPRGETLCAHTVTQPPGHVFLIPDLMEDWRFQECPYLEQGGLRAYAGVPLRIQTESGECVSLGSLCVASKTSEEPLSKTQHQSLVHLADWIVSDLVQCTRLRRQRERHRMSKLITEVQKSQNNTASTQSVLDILRTIYPDAIIDLHSSSAARIQVDKTFSVPTADLEDGLYEDVSYLEDLIANSNNAALPTDRPVRIISAKCEGISGPSLLLVASKDFHFVFDDVDSWFLQTCADMISQFWQQNLLGEALKAKEKFLRAFSHQLRTPVHGILGSVDLLAEELKSLKFDQRAVSPSPMVQHSSAVAPNEPFSYLKTIKMAGHDLTSIIDNFITLNKWMDIAMAERDYALHTLNELEGQLKNEITNFMHGDMRYTTSVFLAHSLSSRCASFRTDLRVVRDALFPLIINAIQHTPHGAISVNASIDVDHKQLTVDIEDNGSGIPLDSQQRIFEAYEKVNIHSAGGGLGLTLASKFSSLLNGSVDLISSHIGRGSHFRVKFGVIECDCFATPPRELPVILTPLPSKIFTIGPDEDNASLVNFLEGFLKKNGFIKSDSIADSIVIFAASSDPELHSANLSSIPPEQIGMCIIPGSEMTLDVKQADRNILYINSPFTTSSLHLTLERAQNYLLGRHPESPASQSCPSTPTSVTQPTVYTLPYTNEKDNSHPLPTELSVPAALNIAAKLLSNSSQPFTLIVDDNIVNLRLMEAYCRRRNLPYLSAVDGQQAIDTFSRHQAQCAKDGQPAIELIFMDLQMPVCGGIEASQRIRLLERQNNWATSFIFVMTGQDSPADRKSAVEAGSNEFCVKPVVLRQLDRTIMEYFPAFEIA